MIELSIALVIIGLIVGGVLVGRDLIAASNLRKNISEIQSVQLAINTFKLKYNGIPGDLRNGSQFFTGIANGNGNGLIDMNGGEATNNIPNGEAYNAAQSLLLSGLVKLPFASLLSTGHSRQGFNITGKNRETVLPPFPERVWQAMQRGGYEYIEDVKHKLKARGLTVYDYSDSSKIVGADDCEFLDGFHAGEVIYARIFSDLMRKQPDLESYVNTEKLSYYLKHYKGWVYPISKEYFPAFTKEGDFLNLGCRQ